MRFLPPLTFLALVVALVGATRADEPYGFPFDDPLAATVVGTPSAVRAELPARVPLQEWRLPALEGRAIPEVFWYEREFRFGLLAQERRAPLVFVIAGTGGDHRGGKVDILLRIFHRIGFHVISLPSPTHQNFIVTASTTSVPGMTPDDAADLYRVMQRAYAAVEDRVDVSTFHLTGYSLGAAQAAFVAQRDEQEQAFDFERVLMINPPVSLYSSALILDRMLDDNLPDGLGEFWGRMMAAFARVYVAEDDIDLTDDDFLYLAWRRNRPKTENLAALIGLAFRILSSNMLFTTDVMINAGYIAPKSPPLRPTDSLTDFAIIAMRTRFEDYIHNVFFPFFKARRPDVTLDQLIFETSLRAIGDYLRSSAKIGLMHNADDFILEEGELDFLIETMGDRARIYPRGGHCGNMDYPVNVDHVIDFFGGPVDGRS